MTDAPTLLRSHRLLLETNIELNEKADVDRIGRLALAALNGELRDQLSELISDQSCIIEGPRGAYTTAGKWGENGRAPQIRDLVQQSEFHRATGKRGIAA